jgi:hypothetical protein
MTYDDVNVLMQKIGPDSADIEEVLQTENDGWAIMFSDKPDVLVECVTEPDRLLFTTLIGLPHVDRRFVVYESLLMFNSLWKENDGAMLGLTGPEGQVAFILEFNITDLTLIELSNMLTRFITLAELWCGYVTSEPGILSSPPVSTNLLAMLA